MTSEFDKIESKIKNFVQVKETEIKLICSKVQDILTLEENVINLSNPITICGDIHGQSLDLFELFKIGGEVPSTNYLFMGDFVDRGRDSMGTLLFLLILKIKFPERIFLIRGNHESRQITQVYGFYDECLKRYGSANVWKMCTEIFDFMPLVATVGQKYFCVHGGLSPQIKTIDEVNSFRLMELIESKKCLMKEQCVI